MNEIQCPDCGSPREDVADICDACGAPPIEEHRKGPESERGSVRQTDLEPYIALRYIARLFKVLAVLMVVMLVGEVVVGLVTHGRNAIITLLGEATRLLVLSGLMWGVGDITMLLIDAGHDLRVSRILLGRINAQLHRRRTEEIANEPKAAIR
ncbi:MAG TPA: zinc ribbon domain-containing protein [Thermoanaerobaculia bacterium]|nr:zinc ribbon domain-containing protein [Thermoanaerobaculia bacterium]